MGRKKKYIEMFGFSWSPSITVQLGLHLGLGLVLVCSWYNDSKQIAFV